MSIEGQGHFLTLAQGCVHIKFELDFLRNYCAHLNQTLYERFYIQGNDTGHMTKKAPHPYMVKNSQNIFLRNRWAEFHVAWYVALGTQAHLSSFKL